MHTERDDPVPDGHVDHLWIRVRDPATSKRFYTTIAPYPGWSWAWTSRTTCSSGAPTTASRSSTVAATVRDLDSGREAVHEIMSAAESDPAAGRLSIDSPLGRALTGARAGV